MVGAPQRNSLARLLKGVGDHLGRLNDALQKKLMEQRDRLKLPDNVSAIKVENGELIMTQK